MIQHSFFERRLIHNARLPMIRKTLDAGGRFTNTLVNVSTPMLFTANCTDDCNRLAVLPTED